MSISTTSFFFLTPPPLPPLSTFTQPSFFPTSKLKPLSLQTTSRRNPFLTRADVVEADSSGPDDYEIDDEEMDEVDNKKDFDIEYEKLAAGDGDIAAAQSTSFVSTQGWDPDTLVDYRIIEDEFHKISLLHCDFFIRKPPDPDNDVYDFREMYVTPPDTDVYSIPKVLAPMPQKVFLTKHYKNRRLGDPEFVLDFEEIYVIDSKTKSITRANVLVTAPGGRTRDRKSDLLVIADKGNSFKIIHMSEKDDPTTVIERREWIQTREEMERHLRKLRDFSTSNWF